MLPVMRQELDSLLVDLPVVDVDEGRCPLEVLQVDVVDDPGVDDDVVLDVGDGEASVDDLALGDGHLVVVHLLVVHLSVHV